uniref:Secretory carrier membrane protein n=1 Tax=Chlamydomonas leiostraca TaxID=1034604 RepID=A0A7S0S0Y4_9CHLO|mmetsp:Transcript_38115/g.96376  ORF Transcript_38115/g.96376 Transcript_38115/m.96376 type:complete len:216 (+) Transcript_38115:152-799(+)|eukprot:CAMPEP_0202858690 /NCGR_PEP_ID=MMETSP1391-20130828/1110_1 /ASSEMBLY_ACC=CAM_ASM_000867 /TAXON_ID=1034604 /ORGANISM="Chlamydomonas leiostraca, Strain SAG 11-49" /LENGTH=215 /DNA_ID=CAMNT_0049537631 /DNA_START=152 /DNA_END=799 /DNA_ORIENTATION=-
MAKIPAIPTFKPPPTGECRRIILWVFWTLNMLLNFIYMCLSFATASRLGKSAADVKANFISNAAWRAPVAACVLGGLMVLFFNIFSCVVLIRKSIHRQGPGFGYGFIMAWSFVMSFFCFLCGLILDAFDETVRSHLEEVEQWKTYWTGAYIGTVVFAFLCCAMFMIFFLCLVIFQGGISKAIGLYDPRTDEKRKLEMAALGHMQTANPLAASPAI